MFTQTYQSENLGSLLNIVCLIAVFNLTSLWLTLIRPHGHSILVDVVLLNIWRTLHCTIPVVIIEPRCEKTGLRIFPTWSDTNQTVQLQKMARSLKFRIYVVEGLYYLYSENKGADQLHGYREADLRLCFCICKKPFFS